MVEFYFGGRGNERLQGKVVRSAGGVLVLKNGGRRNDTNLEKVLAAWEV